MSCVITSLIVSIFFRLQRWCVERPSCRWPTWHQHSYTRGSEECHDPWWFGPWTPWGCQSFGQVMLVCLIHLLSQLTNIYPIGARLCSVCWLTTAANPCTRNWSQPSAKNTTSPWWRWTITRSSASGLVFAKLTKRARPARSSDALALPSRIGELRPRQPLSFSITWRSSKFQRLTSNEFNGMCLSAAHVSCCVRFEYILIKVDFMRVFLIVTNEVLGGFWSRNSGLRRV